MLRTLERVLHAFVEPSFGRRLKLRGAKMDAGVRRPPELAPGDRVVLSGLNTTSLNGAAGVLTEFDMESGRWRVALPDGVKAIKPENLSPA